VKDLRGFRKIILKAGEAREVTFTITPDDLKFYNSELIYDWEAGEFIIHIGSNSEDTKSARISWEK
jgi:beta-glucosidase